MPSGAIVETDVLVCGAGCAGLVAALSAARCGAKTLLVERAGFAGGIITTVGLPYFDGIAIPNDNRILVRGIPLELLTAAGILKTDAVRVTPHNPIVKSIEQVKLIADRLLAAEKELLRVWYHATVCDVVVAGDRVSEVLVATKSGLMRVRPMMIVDCTGDGDVVAWSGAPTVKNDPLMPLTMHFRIGNVERRPDHSQLCKEQLVAAHAAGELKLFYGPGLIFAFAPNEAYIHAIRVVGDATDVDDLSRAEMQGRADVWTMFERWKKNVPGFEKSYLISTGPYIGIRETRRLVGQYVLTEDDIRAQTKFDDAIATGCWYLDVHPQKVTVGSANEKHGFQPGPYDIPYRSLQPQKVANLLVAGRCHSASKLAASSTRVTVTAMAMGEAAGTAAAVAVERRTTAAELQGSDVRDALYRRHAGPFLG